MQRRNDLSIIIVTYNSAKVISDCLKSIIESDALRKEIFVVDNASADETLSIIRNSFPSVNLIENKINRGFAAANNQAINECSGEIILFLNPDTVVRPNCLERICSFLKANEKIGLAGTKVLNPDGSVQDSVSYKYPGHRYAADELQGLKGEIAAILGAGMAGRYSVIAEAGGFDESFFLYGEDEDLCLRIRKLGYEIGYIDQAEIIHIGGHSERNSKISEVWTKKVRAGQLFFRKHYSARVIERINRAELIKAAWRLVTLHMALAVAGDRRLINEKIAKYKVIWTEIRKNNLVRS